MDCKDRIFLTLFTPSVIDLAFPTLTINATCMICVNLGITKILQMNF